MCHSIKLKMTKMLLNGIVMSFSLISTSFSQYLFYWMEHIYSVSGQNKATSNYWVKLLSSDEGHIHSWCFSWSEFARSDRYMTFSLNIKSKNLSISYLGMSNEDMVLSWILKFFQFDHHIVCYWHCMNDLAIVSFPDVVR